METVRKRFGLLGRNISYSFSKGYFTEKFKTENLEGYTYENFDLTSLDEFSASIANTTDLKGINVTIPYKEAIMLHLDSLSKKSSTNRRCKYY
jgi:shikimate dehydrogenase